MCPILSLKRKLAQRRLRGEGLGVNGRDLMGGLDAGPGIFLGASEYVRSLSLRHRHRHGTFPFPFPSQLMLKVKINEKKCGLSDAGQQLRGGPMGRGYQEAVAASQMSTLLNLKSYENIKGL